MKLFSNWGLGHGKVSRATCCRHNHFSFSVFYFFVIWYSEASSRASAASGQVVDLNDLFIADWTSIKVPASSIILFKIFFLNSYNSSEWITLWWAGLWGGLSEVKSNLSAITPSPILNLWWVAERRHKNCMCIRLCDRPCGRNKFFFIFHVFFHFLFNGVAYFFSRHFLVFSVSDISHQSKTNVWISITKCWWDLPSLQKLLYIIHIY